MHILSNTALTKGLVPYEILSSQEWRFSPSKNTNLFSFNIHLAAVRAATNEYTTVRLEKKANNTTGAVQLLCLRTRLEISGPGVPGACEQIMNLQDLQDVILDQGARLRQFYIHEGRDEMQVR